MQNKSSFFVILGYLYLILPILIFFIGYCNIPTAIIGTLIIGISSYFLYKNAPEIWMPQNKKEWITVILTAVISFIWVYSSGIGALVFQNTDHNCRNPIFEYLVSMNWPIISTDGGTILTYYIGFWLPSAVVGKLFHSIQIGYYCQVAWATLGVFLTLYYILSVLKRKTLLPVIIFILFSGLDILGSILTHRYHFLPITAHIEWWFPGFQFSSFTTQLYWVFNQALPAWLITMLLYNEKNNKNIIFLYSCLFLCSTLPAIGILPMIFWWGIKNGENDFKTVFSKNHLINAVKSGLTFSNVIGGLFITLVCYLYLSYNLSGSHIAVKIPTDIVFITYWILLFFLLEAGLYILCIFKTQKKNPLFYICILSLIIYPFIFVGLSADFCMRATIPALVILYLFVVQALENKEFLQNKFLSAILIIALLIGNITPIHEIARTIINTSLGYRKIESNLSGTNFLGNTQGNKFLIYFGKNYERK